LWEREIGIKEHNHGEGEKEGAYILAIACAVRIPGVLCAVVLPGNEGKGMD
jgi:hypothetical protein